MAAVSLKKAIYKLLHLREFDESDRSYKQDSFKKVAFKTFKKVNSRQEYYKVLAWCPVTLHNKHT